MLFANTFCNITNNKVLHLKMDESNWVQRDKITELDKLKKITFDSLILPDTREKRELVQSMTIPLRCCFTFLVTANRTNSFYIYIMHCVRWLGMCLKCL